MSAISPAQIRAIHTLKSKAGLDEESYRDELGRLGVASSKDLSQSAAIGLIDHLRVLAGDRKAPRESTSRPVRGALSLSGPYAGICRALWISGWNLGVFEAREDTALVAFVRRQTGIDHLNWVRDPADAKPVIEGLKGWLAREANVDWRKAGKLDDRDQSDRVIAAQLRLPMTMVDGVSAAHVHRLERWRSRCATPAEKIEIMQVLGTAIRRHQAAQHG